MSRASYLCSIWNPEHQWAKIREAISIIIITIKQSRSPTLIILFIRNKQEIINTYSWVDNLRVHYSKKDLKKDNWSNLHLWVGLNVNQKFKLFEFKQCSYISNDHNSQIKYIKPRKIKLKITHTHTHHIHT